MGGGSWDDDLYARQKTTRRQKGQDDFSYDATLKTKSYDQWKVHPSLDPLAIKKVRESRDSEDHPTSLAIYFSFDVTGSMGDIPRVVKDNLNKLMDSVKNKGKIEHPQIMVSAIGDTRNSEGLVVNAPGSDNVPFQVSQFESDNRIDEQLGFFFLEGGGQGQVHEAYGLTYYMAGYKTSIDCWEKRQKKGYLFTTGDEMPWPEVTKKEIARVFSDKLERDLTLEEILEKTLEMYEVFHIIATGGSHGREPRVQRRWRELLGERVILMDNPSKICDIIADTIARTETYGVDPLAGLNKAKPGTDQDDKKKKTGRVF